ncbi:MAG TPA: cysteine rich repeat-containing protein [Myxococcaceae bacterium]|nr:cysteine rich repeat-containing protein [Myxococcaceae bacterium]
MIRSSKAYSTLLAVAAVLFSQLAFADTAAPKPCEADVKKLCKGIKPGGGAILICLEQKTDKVSAACKESLTEKAQAVEGACKPDIDKFCATVKEGEGRILQCLAKHEAEMSADCKAFWGAAKSKAKAAAK